MPGAAVGRAITWGPVAGAVAIAVAALASMRPWAMESVGLGAARLVAIIVVAGAGFTIDDPAASVLAASPTPLPARRTWRIAFATLVTVSSVIVLVGAASVVAGRSPDLPVGALALEMAAMGAVVLAVSASRRSDGGAAGGAVGAGALFSFLLSAVVVQARWPEFGLFPAGPLDPQWERAHATWAVVLVAALAWLVHSSLDPARPRRRTKPAPSAEQLAGAGDFA